ncbi:hypothetical protein AAW51_3002 [Caldimonas brevitalea]|uniref:DoxX family membrane protein n=1 Tax=Caldimonas brevitalea TaxID=413882 RepID=A0A0G3BNY0_9BURK|nr:hypothetical protein AAW51_3002 [Caldimonas brevitalea]
MACVAATALLLNCTGAYAHVKWFSKVVNCTSTPLNIGSILASPMFVALFIAALAVMAGVCRVDKLAAERYPYLHRSPSVLEHRRADRAALLLRVGVGIYFLSVFLYRDERPFILTPELWTKATWVPLVQLAIAAAVLSRHTVPLAAAGILLLYGNAVALYGWFHMLDYLYFIGVASFLAISVSEGQVRPSLGFTLLRVLTGFSLMWVSVEKWVYPSWTYDILARDLANITMGLDPRFVVMAAGFVEFSLAFLIVFGRLSARVAAVALLALLIGAIPLVGMLDAVGHAPLIVVLLVFAAGPNPLGAAGPNHLPWNGRAHAISFAAGVVGLIGLYHVTHALAYPRLDNVLSLNMLVAAAMLIPLRWVTTVGCGVPARRYAAQI